WNVANAVTSRPAEMILTLSSSALGVGDARFSADGKSLVVASDEIVNVWALSAGAAAKTLSRRRQNPRTADDFLSRPHFIGLSSDAKLYFSSDKTTVKTFDTRTGAELSSLPLSMRSTFGKLATSRDGGRLAVATGFDPMKNIFNASQALSSGDQQVQTPGAAV